jgi:transposase
MVVTPRTVYNFVMFVRHKYNIPVVAPIREYFPIEELPYRQQAQVDFGEYNMRFENGNRKKVWFFAMVLSRSRMKYIWFSGTHFTAETVSEAHEKAFAFFDGIPTIVVYDQDRTMVVDENMGDIILTSTFKQYTKSRNFKLHFCRKADPESKGKVENVIQYVKKNFLYNRPFSDIETLNQHRSSGLVGKDSQLLGSQLH